MSELAGNPEDRFLTSQLTSVCILQVDYITDYDEGEIMYSLF